MVSYPQKPDVVVLTHAPNDIEGAAKDSGVNPPLLPEPSQALRRLTDRSYFFDFAYWRGFVLTQRSRKWADFILGCYEYDNVWSKHEEYLDTFVSWARDEEVRLVVVVFPWLNRIADSRPFTARVPRFLEWREIPFADLSLVFAGRAPSQLVVNGFDSHPNEAVHGEVAELILDMIRGY